MTNRIPMKGATLKLTITATPTLIPQVTSIDDIIGAESAMIDTTDLDSTAVQNMGGIINWGEMSFKLNFDPSDTTHVAIRTHHATLTEATFLVTLADTGGATIQVVGPIKTCKLMGGATTDLFKGEVTVKINSLTLTP